MNKAPTETINILKAPPTKVTCIAKEFISFRYGRHKNSDLIQVSHKKRSCLFSFELTHQINLLFCHMIFLTSQANQRKHAGFCWIRYVPKQSHF